jgi:hypothetical protein
MEEKRQFDRFDPGGDFTGYFELKNEITGQFSNREEFVIKNISVGGFNLLSNYSPNIGRDYRIFVNYDELQHEFEVKIVHSRIFRYLDKQDGFFRPGVVFSHGCQIVFENDRQKSLVLDIIKNECEPPTVNSAE